VGKNISNQFGEIRIHQFSAFLNQITTYLYFHEVKPIAGARKYTGIFSLIYKKIQGN